MSRRRTFERLRAEWRFFIIGCNQSARSSVAGDYLVPVLASIAGFGAAILCLGWSPNRSVAGRRPNRLVDLKAIRARLEAEGEPEGVNSQKTAA